MKSLSSFFSKFENLIPPERSIKRAAVEAVKDVLSISIDQHVVVVNRDVVSFRLSSVMKSEIKLHENDILRALNSRLGETKKRINKIL